MKKLILALTLVMGLSAYAQMEGITVTGTVTRSMEPDEMSIQFIVVSEADDVKTAFEENEGKSRSIIAYLNGLEEACEFSSEQASLRERKEYRNGEQYRVGFVASQSFHLTVNDFEKYPEIVSKLIGFGVENLSMGRFRYSKSDEVKTELRTEAIRVAKEKAQVIAEELGVELGIAQSFIESSPGSPMPYANLAYMDGVMAREDSSGPSVAPGKETISMSVTVRFAILAPESEQ